MSEIKYKPIKEKVKVEPEKGKAGYVRDFITNTWVKATPEEIEAVQIFVKQLVEDYNYPKTHIQTRPQYRVKQRPSGGKDFPVDIVVFSSNNHTFDNEYILVECKKKNRKDGKKQLEDYLHFSKAYLGVWFNGEERLFLRKIEKQGKIFFEEIPNIPQYGQRVEDIGKFRRKDLKPTHNLKATFKAIRNHLAGNFTGVTRDEELAKVLINLIFCKIYDERFTKPNDVVTFRVGVGENLRDVKKRIIDLFDKVKSKYSAVIDVSDKIDLDDERAIAYVVGELQNYCLVDSERDAIADAFETFIGYALKGAEGQFFTPRNVVKLMVEIVNPKPRELVIDPACGSGGFLIGSLKHMWNTLDKQAETLGWNDLALQEEKITTAIHNIRGIEKDNFLSKVAKAYMALIGDGKGGIFCEDSLEQPKEWKDNTRQNIDLGKFDVLLTNPPFGKDIKIVGEEKLKQYDLAHQWKKEGNAFEKTNKIKEEESPQIIFIERSLQLLKDGGRMGIVLPETFLHAPNSRYVLKYILKNNNITWICDLPHNTFRPHNNAKCIVIILEKNKPQQKFINMAVAEEMGHNHQGKEIYRWNYRTKQIDREELWDDIPLILKEYKTNKFDKYCFKVDFSSCDEKNIFVPRYYWQTKFKEIERLAKEDNLELISINKLIKEKVITFFDGHGSPPAEYKGMGEIPYVRVKDIVNWEIYKDPTAKIPEDIYLKKKGIKKILKEKDIAYVRRGSYRIGSIAMVSPYDKEVLLTREILILRVIEENNKYNLTPHYLLYLLSHKLTSMQANNKILIETTLPNIANRWKELRLPISKNKNERKRISEKIKSVIENKWQAIKGIEKLREEFGELTT